MSKSKIGKCQRTTRSKEEPWFRARRRRNRIRTKMAKASRKINRGK